MTADINEHSAISPDHQLPAHVPARPRHKVVRVVMWSLLLLVLVLAFVLVLRHHEDAEKSGGRGTPCAGDHRYECDGSKGQHRRLP